ncbi:hypothetical protein BB712_04355 [Listeria monocytogenes]|nr:predicted protein [Listeria monocytogenes FSL N1-017]ODC76126.1 hypothetical protein BB621_04470 [Listeria monocytogenes]ODG24695.1 hypothetical protein BB712_04355 [Listeria monocytogenes]
MKQSICWKVLDRDGFKNQVIGSMGERMIISSSLFCFYILVQLIHVKKGYTQNIHKTISVNAFFSMYS